MPAQSRTHSALWTLDGAFKPTVGNSTGHCFWRHLVGIESYEGFTGLEIDSSRLHTFKFRQCRLHRSGTGRSGHARYTERAGRRWTLCDFGFTGFRRGGWSGCTCTVLTAANCETCYDCGKSQQGQPRECISKKKHKRHSHCFSISHERYSCPSNVCATERIFTLLPRRLGVVCAAVRRKERHTRLS